MARAQLKDTWITATTLKAASSILESFCDHQKMQIESRNSASSVEIVASQGSQITTRLLGGWFVDPINFPKRARILLKLTNDGTSVEAEIEETLGFGILDSNFKRRYEDYFRNWMLALASALPPKPEAVLVHVTRDGQQFGPYKMRDVQGYLMTGDLRPDDLAWHDGLTEWVTLRALTSGTQKTSLANPSVTGALAGKNQGSSQHPQATQAPSLRALASVGGMLCYIFAAIDFAGMFFHYDLTGVSWSPIVAGLIGSALVQCGEAK